MRNEIRGFEPTMSAKRTLTCLRSASQQASEANNFSPCSLAVEPAVATLSPTLLSGGLRVYAIGAGQPRALVPCSHFGRSSNRTILAVSGT